MWIKVTAFRDGIITSPSVYINCVIVGTLFSVLLQWTNIAKDLFCVCMQQTVRPFIVACVCFVNIKHDSVEVNRWFLSLLFGYYNAIRPLSSHHIHIILCTHIHIYTHSFSWYIKCCYVFVQPAELIPHPSIWLWQIKSYYLFGQTKLPNRLGRKSISFDCITHFSILIVNEMNSFEVYYLCCLLL